MKDTLGNIDPPALPLRAPPREIQLDGRQGSKHTHQFAKEALLRIGEALGKSVAAEEAFGEFRLDVVWKDNMGVYTHGFEVQHQGSLEAALARLTSLALDPAVLPVLVVSSSRHGSRALRLVEGAQAPFAQLNSRLVVLDMHEVRLLSRFLSAMTESVRPLLRNLNVLLPND